MPAWCRNPDSRGGVKAAGMTAKSVKYPGKLGKPITVRESGAAVAEAMLGAQGGGLEAGIAAINEWEAGREVALLYALLDHYGIAPDDELKWFRLAQKLAFAHVPAFRFASRVGRPRKLKPFARLSDLLPRSKGKPGRKRKYTDGRYRGLLKIVRETCAERGLKGRGAVTKALKQCLSEIAYRGNESVTKVLTRDLSFWQKRYSEAKKRFPEIA